MNMVHDILFSQISAEKHIPNDMVGKRKTSWMQC